MIVKGLGPVEIQAVGEQQQLGLGIRTEFFIVLDHLFAPLIGIAAVVADAGEVVDHGPVEVQQEQVGGQRVGEGGAVVAPILVVPVLQGIVVGIAQRDGADALIHLDKFMGIGADGGQIVFHGKPDVGGAHQVVGLLGQTANHDLLPIPGEPSAAAEFCQREGVFAGVEVSDLLIQPLLRGFQQHVIVVLHPEVDLVDDLQQVNLKLHGGEQRTPHHHGQLALGAQLGLHVVADRMPEAEELHIVVLDKSD